VLEALAEGHRHRTQPDRLLLRHQANQRILDAVATSPGDSKLIVCSHLAANATLRRTIPLRCSKLRPCGWAWIAPAHLIATVASALVLSWGARPAALAGVPAAAAP